MGKAFQQKQETFAHIAATVRKKGWAFQTPMPIYPSITNPNAHPPPPSDPLPPLSIQKVQHSKTELLAGDQALKHMSPWGTFHFKA